jgi:hypothetical protein
MFTVEGAAGSLDERNLVRQLIGGQVFADRAE